MALQLQVEIISNVFGFSRGAFSPVGAELRATAALEGSGARPPGCRSSSEPQRPWEPGWARNSQGCRACGRTRQARHAGLTGSRDTRQPEQGG